MMGIVYRVTNNITGKFYIGSTKTTLLRRAGQHWSDATSGNKRGRFQEALIQSSPNDWSWEILFEVEDLSLLRKYERDTIKLLDACGENGLNMKQGGNLSNIEGLMQWKKSNPIPHNKGKYNCLSDLSRERMRAAKLGKPGPKVSEETKLKMRAAHQCKRVKCIETGKEYDSLNLAATEFGVPRQWIRRSCNSGGHVYGFTFCFV
jgi:group I intron endonuclease